jgi:4-hydroxythreonine-4-phosphate dehydrogenase
MIRIGITQGDINGIGYELILKTMQSPEILEICTPIIFGSAKVVDELMHTFELESFPLNVIKNVDEAIDGRVNLVDLSIGKELQVQWGQQTEEALRAEADSLTAAIHAHHNRKIDLLVTAPGNLDNDLESHALCEFVHRVMGGEETSFDWVINGSLRTLALHSPEASTELGEGIARENIVNDIRNVNTQLRRSFRFIEPHIAVLCRSLKLESILNELRENHVMAFGPFDPASFVEKEMWRHYDAVLFLDCEKERYLLLDQQEKESTYGFVSGLPLIITYPLIPISYEIAGKGIADEIPFRQAIYAGIDIYRNRRAFASATRHPLEKQWIPKGRDDVKLDLSKSEDEE